MYETTISYGSVWKPQTIYMRFYKNQRILELQCRNGIPINLFMTLKNHLKSKYQNVEIRVI